MRQIIVAGNWKMNASKDAVNTLVSGILADMSMVKSKVIICAPYPYLPQADALINTSSVHLGAQNINPNKSGAFTGEVSADMLAEFGVEYVIIGHSERRSLYFENDEVVAEKVDFTLKNGLTPIFCIGESLQEREGGKTESIVERQVNAIINNSGIKAFANIIIAYEPIWAIGTGKTATSEQAQAVHSFIRNLLASHDPAIAATVSILYGGSMNPGNAAELLACPDIDGGLIGGASLQHQDFLQICKAG